MYVGATPYNYYLQLIISKKELCVTYWIKLGSRIQLVKKHIRMNLIVSPPFDQHPFQTHARENARTIAIITTPEVLEVI